MSQESKKINSAAILPTCRSSCLDSTLRALDYEQIANRIRSSNVLPQSTHSSPTVVTKLTTSAVAPNTPLKSSLKTNLPVITSAILKSNQAISTNSVESSKTVTDCNVDCIIMSNQFTQSMSTVPTLTSKQVKSQVASLK